MYHTIRTCRFCKLASFETPGRDLVRYGVRHHAHYECYLDAGKPLSGLHDWQVARLPWKLVLARGLQDEVMAAVARVARIQQM